MEKNIKILTIGWEPTLINSTLELVHKKLKINFVHGLIETQTEFL